jgi:hypothetical protein
LVDGKSQGLRYPIRGVRGKYSRFMEKLNSRVGYIRLPFAFLLAMLFLAILIPTMVGLSLIPRSDPVSRHII